MPAWLWPNVLSLDAPFVAVLWQVLLARSLGIALGRYELLVLGASIWLVYLADRVLDSLSPPQEGWEPPRKHFYRRHVRGAAALATFAALLIVPAAFVLLHRAVFEAGLVLSTLLAGYFVCVHFVPRCRSWPRQFAVALVFTLGTFLALWVAAGGKRFRLAAPGLMFLLLCWLNCAVVEIWEWRAAGARPERSPDASTVWLVRHAMLAAIGIAMLAGVLAATSFLTPAAGAACSLSGVALAAVSAWAGEFSPELLPLAADLALCTPLLVIPFLRP